MTYRTDAWLFVWLGYHCYVHCYMITENGDKTGNGGHKTTWYVMRGGNIAIPCHYKAPAASADEDPSKFIWTKPPYVQKRYQLNDDKQLAVKHMQVTDSGILSCKSAGVTHQHTVLAVEEPVWANVSRSMKFVSAGSCARSSIPKLVDSIRKEVCAYPQLAVHAKNMDGGQEKKCRVRVESHCAKSTTSSRYALTITISVDVPNFEACMGPRVKATCVSYETVAQRLCMPEQKCHLDFMCHQNFTCIEDMQYAVYRRAVRFAFARMKGVVSDLLKKSSPLLHGLTPVFNPLLPMEITAKCAHPGFKLLHHVLCVPCIPHTWLARSPGTPTPRTCATCVRNDSPDRFGASDCASTPRDPPETVRRKWPKWMRIPTYLTFTTAVPPPPSMSPPPPARVVEETTTAPKAVAVTEAPPRNAPLKVLAIVMLILTFMLLVIFFGLQLKKLKANILSRYEKLQDEDRATREEETAMLIDVQQSNRHHQRQHKKK